MKNQILLGCLFYFLCGCEGLKQKSILIKFENNSDLDTLLTIDTYVNSQNIKSTSVRRDSSKINDALVIIHVNEKPEKELEFRFIVQSTRDTTSCKILPSQFEKLGYIHVNFVKTVFRKGFVVFGKTLGRDSVAHNEFYCEGINKEGVRIE